MSEKIFHNFLTIQANMGIPSLNGDKQCGKKATIKQFANSCGKISLIANISSTNIEKLKLILFGSFSNNFVVFFKK